MTSEMTSEMTYEMTYEAEKAQLWQGLAAFLEDGPTKDEITRWIRNHASDSATRMPLGESLQAYGELKADLWSRYHARKRGDCMSHFDALLAP